MAQLKQQYFGHAEPRNASHLTHNTEPKQQQSRPSSQV